MSPSSQQHTSGFGGSGTGSSVQTDRYEPPRITVVGTKLAPPVEAVRWLLEQRHIPYIEQSHVPVLHAFSSLRHGVDLELPLLLTPEGPHAGLKDALEAIDRLCRPGERVLGESDAAAADLQDWFERFDKKLFRQAVQVYYHAALSHRSFATKYATLSVPFWQKALVRMLYPLWTWALRRGLQLGTFDQQGAHAAIEEVFSFVEERVAKQGPFIHGPKPGTADILFASLAAPVVMPDGFGSEKPADNELPHELLQTVMRYRDRPGGKLVQQIYRTARPKSQPRLRRARGRSLLARLRTPTAVRLLSRFAVRFTPRVGFGNTLFFARWRDVVDVLTKDDQFLIEPVNKARIDAVNGPFILGMDRNPELFPQRAYVYSALARAEKEPFLTALQQEPQRILTAAQAKGRLDVINGYARLVAGRAAARFFGLHGPTEQDLLRVLRALFHQTFLNQGGNRKVEKLGLDAAAEFKIWADEEIDRRRSNGSHGNDVLGRLVSATADDDPTLARRMLGGLIVGAVDTTATAVGNIVAELVTDRSVLDAMRSDIDDPDLLRGWCWEVLRRRPHNAGMLRVAGPGAHVAGVPVRSGRRVILLTLGAMYDPSAFERPGVLNPRRPADRYLHFGYGIHQCAGRDINAFQIPTLVRHLLGYDIARLKPMRYQGPFPDSLTISVKTRAKRCTTS